MKLDLRHFITERAEQLAIVHLTRNHDLAVERMKADSGLDMLVTILRDRLPTGRVFGIQVKAEDSTFNDLHTPEPTLSSQEARYLQELPFPVYVLLFTMDDDKGYCRSLNYLSAATPSLRGTVQDQWRSLEEYPIAQIVADANAWYDQRSQSAA